MPKINNWLSDFHSLFWEKIQKKKTNSHNSCKVCPGSKDSQINLWKIILNNQESWRVCKKFALVSSSSSMKFIKQKWNMRYFLGPSLIFRSIATLWKTVNANWTTKTIRKHSKSSLHVRKRSWVSWKVAQLIGSFHWFWEMSITSGKWELLMKQTLHRLKIDWFEKTSAWYVHIHADK